MLVPVSKLLTSLGRGSGLISNSRVRQGLVTPVFEFNSSLGWSRLPGVDEVSNKSSLCLELGCIYKQHYSSTLVCNCCSYDHTYHLVPFRFYFENTHTYVKNKSTSPS